MIIQHNVMALNAHRQLTANNASLQKNIEKLSSGFKINRAGDDASGLAISEKMRAQIAGLQVAQNNAQDGISLIQTAEGALTEVHSMLNRMVELAEKSANGTLDDTVDRKAIQKEVNDLLSEIDRISKATNFNGINLLDGSMTGKYYGEAISAGTGHGADPVTVSGGRLTAGDAITLNISEDGDVKLASLAGIDAADFGANGITIDPVSSSGAGTHTFVVSLDKSTATAENYEKLNGLVVTIETTGNGTAGAGTNVTFTVQANAEGKISSGLMLQIGDTNDHYQKVSVSIDDLSAAGLGIDGLEVDNQDKAGAAIAKIKDAINKVSTNRANLGGLQNRLEHTINNLAVTEENMTAAESRIRDVDMAKEMMAYTKNNVLTQAAQAMLAQANTQPQSVLQLLQ